MSSTVNSTRFSELLRLRLFRFRLPQYLFIDQAPIVRRVDSMHYIYLLDDSINFDRPVHWIVIYPVDSALLPFNNWGQDLNRFMF